MENRTSTRAKAPLSARQLTGSVDRLDLLQTLVTIVESGNLSSAAKALGTTQPTVSRRLQQLERSLGCVLLSRSTHKMALTEEGDRCYQRAKEILAGWSTFEADFGGGDVEPGGLLRIVAPHAFGQQLLGGVLAEYLTRYPKVSVEWLLSDVTPDFIAEGLDCAILVGEVRDPLNVAVRLAEVPRIVVASPALIKGREAKLGVRDLASLPWLSLKTFYQKEVELYPQGGGDRYRFPIRPRFSTDNLYALRDAAKRGLGAAIVSAWIVAGDLANHELVRLVPEWSAPPLPLHIVYPYARFYPPKLKRFVETLRELVSIALGDTVKLANAEKRGKAGSRVYK
jgi:DNA-binding transcriptional LysR family regulator